MNNKTVVFSILCIFLSISFSGCIQEEERIDDHIISVDINGNGDYQSIQAAIHASTVNDTILVNPGIYTEHLFINKSVTMRGVKKNQTIINGNDNQDIITVSETGRLTISQFTLQHCGNNHTFPDYNAAIDLNSNYNNLSDLIIRDNAIGIYTAHIRYNNISNISFLSNSEYGIYFYTDSKFNYLTQNWFENNSCGLRIKGSNENIIVGNIFLNNQKGMYFCCGARKNLAFHNTFLNNSQYHGNDFVEGNEWDNDYPAGGNYWDDYQGDDNYSGIDQNISGSDGIGDIPYNVTSDGKKKDYYPLMTPVKT